jgi:uncharacterized protein YjbI with pentapeptide repeats
MADFTGDDLSGSRFERVDLTGAQFRAADLSQAWFRGVDLSRVVMRGVELIDVRIDGEIQNVLVNGVDIAPLVNAELDRGDPDRAKMRPTQPGGFREAWGIVERRWDTPSSGLAASTPGSCTSLWTASGRSLRHCATWCSPPTRGCAEPSSAIRPRGAR